MLRIGWSRRDVSTKEPIYMPGQFHARISRGVKDPIMLSCLVIEDENDIVVFLAGDFVFVDGLIGEIKDKIRKKAPSFAADKVLISATHTHSSPCHFKKDLVTEIPHEGIQIYPNEKYRDFLTDMAAEAVLEAYETREAGGIAYGYGYAVTSHCRRVVYRDDISLRPGYRPMVSIPQDGYVRMYGDTSDDMFQGYESGADHYVNIMFTFDRKENITGAIINISCPSQISEQEYVQTADFWNEVRESLRKKYGDIGILPQCAAAGDLSPRTLHYKKAETRRFTLKYDKSINRQNGMSNRLDISERICAAFDEVYSWSKKEIIYDAEITHAVKKVLLEARLIQGDEYECAFGELERLKQIDYVSTGDTEHDFYENSKLDMIRKRMEGIIRRYEKQQAEKEKEVVLHIIKIGDIAFATNPFELYIDISIRFRPEVHLSRLL